MARLHPEFIAYIDPRTGQSTGQMPCTPPADVAAHVARARQAGRAWAAEPLERRMERISAFKHALLARGDDIVALLQAEIGKPAAEAWSSEVLTAADLFEGWLAQIEELLSPSPVDLSPIDYPGKEVVVHPVARGVIGMIMPWNYPFHLPLRTMVPALLAGNAVVWKPSEHAAQVGALIGEVAAKVLPKDLLITVQGGAAVGEALIDAGVDRVVFTGSLSTGRRVAARAAAKLIECSLELGSKDAAIVLHDAPLERTVNGIVWGAFHNAGQDCAAIEQVFVDKRIYDVFVKKVVEAASALRPGVDIGPLITAEQRDKLETRLAEAQAKGATLHCGGKRFEAGFGLTPAVLTGLQAEMALLTEETFGPILPIMPFETEAEAVERVNASPFGLCASVWTKDERRGRALMAQLEVGSVFLNNCCFTGPMAMAAWSGRRQSGQGVTGSRYALDGLVLPRTVVVDRSGGKKELWWYPYNDAFTGLLRGLVTLRRQGGSKIAALSAVLRGFLGRWSS